MPLPTFLVVGAQKCGTTSLHAYLDRHPKIGMSTTKEVNFFNWHWDRGLDWYGDHFGTEPVRGETCPQYAAHPAWPEVPERAAATIPGLRIIYAIRDPAERIASAWIHASEKGVERRSFRELVFGDDFPNSGYVAMSRFHTQLEIWRQFIPDERILVLDQADLLRSPQTVLDRVVVFLGLDPAEFPAFEEARDHVSSAKRRPPDAALRILGRRASRNEPIPAYRQALASRITRRWGTSIERPSLSPDVRSRIVDLLGEEYDLARALAHEV